MEGRRGLVKSEMNERVAARETLPALSFCTTENE